MKSNLNCDSITKMVFEIGEILKYYSLDSLRQIHSDYIISYRGYKKPHIRKLINSIIVTFDFRFVGEHIFSDLSGNSYILPNSYATINKRYMFNLHIKNNSMLLLNGILNNKEYDDLDILIKGYNMNDIVKKYL